MITESDIPNDAVLELKSVVGDLFFENDIDSRKRYSRSTLSNGTTPSAIIKPKNVSEIQKIVKISLKYGLKIHPISTGKNWGYSDACAPTDKNIILELSRMNTILAIDEELCYATIEPGVTQGQLYDFLDKNNINLWMDATGAGPDTSIIGNIMERGFGHTPYGDRYAHSCAYEIILPDGEILNTGFGHYKNSKVSEVYKWGVGPSIDGLFTQSNLGIITKLTIWLLPKPENFQVLFFTLKDEDDIAEFIDCVRPLRIDGTLKSVIHINNDLRTVSILQEHPFDEPNNDDYLSKEKRSKLTKKHNIGFWTGTAGFYGSKKQNDVDLKRVSDRLKNLKGVKLTLVVDEFFLTLFEKIIRIANIFGGGKKINNIYRRMRSAFDLLQGKSPAFSVYGRLWKSKGNKNNYNKIRGTAPLDSESGFYWISPILQMRGIEVKKLTSLIEPVFNKYNFDFLQTISMISERSMCAVTTICFNKNNEQESAMAERCHDEVVQLLIKNGYIMYRAGNQTMKYLQTDSSVFFDFLKKIKKIIDPSNMLSPGRYIPD